MHQFINDYYTLDGKLFRKSDNKEVGWLNDGRYMCFDHNGKKYLVHRAIFLLFYGYLPDLVDHIDQNKLHNDPSNLRDFTKSKNAFNSGNRIDNKSGYRGVFFDKSTKSKNKWCAYIFIMGKRFWGGRHPSFDDAYNARLGLEEEYYSDIH